MTTVEEEGTCSFTQEDEFLLSVGMFLRVHARIVETASVLSDRRDCGRHLLVE